LVDQTLEELTELLSRIAADAAENGRLPTERELAEGLGVNRSTLRERLAVVETLGFVRRTQGSGTYLAMPDPTFVQLYFEMALKVNYMTYEQLEEARELLEHEVAYSAALHATAEDTRALEDALNRVLEAKNAEAGAEADYEFHLDLARATHNPVILLIMGGLSSVLRRVFLHRQRLARSVPGGSERTNNTHIAILDAVLDHDANRAVAAMDEHFLAWNRESAKVASLRKGDNRELPPRKARSST
jgi:DNA-binding FadR family transcriptional regulator